MQLMQLGAEVTMHNGDDPTAFFKAVDDTKEDGRPALVVMMGTENTAFKSAAEVDWQWRENVRDYPRSGVNFIGMWPDLSPIPETRYGAIQDEFAAMVFVDAPVHTIDQATTVNRTLIPQNAPGRVLYYDAFNAHAGVRQVAALAPFDVEDWEVVPAWMS